MLIVVALSLLAAFLWALSAVLQQRAAMRASRRGSLALDRVVPGHGLMLALMRDPLWFAGWLANLGGFLVQAGALYLGSVAVVQPLIVAQLLFALPLSRVGSGRPLPHGAWWAAGAVSAGLGVLLTVRGKPPEVVHVDDTRLIAAIAVTVAVGVAITVVSIGRPPALRAPMFGIAGGFFYALNAVLIKRTVGLLVDHGVLALAASWHVYALIAAMITSMTLSQTAYASGPFAGAVTGMNITNPVVSYLLAVLVYGVPAPTAPHQVIGLTAAAALVIVGVTGLARMLLPSRPVGTSVAVPVQEAVRRRRAAGAGRRA
ncbi:MULTISPECIES: DMT family transporter [Pseudofrankia]|uniref:DMT family transporter n=1 Tax=Pseudofrankia TaxID=2994363 RepID=UPI000234C5FD|nr:MULTISPECIES: DMT family transporter [Pseudofrankia]OHV32441.1 hypothetical protein BCD49_29855 [Pseudofrankia sp. EUN1h]